MLFASNHVAARIAFDHGASVITGVASRACGTAALLFLLMRLQGVPIRVPGRLVGPMILTGVIAALQSYCLYSAVAIMPAALALLVFQTSPMLFVILSWVMGRDRPRPAAIAAIVIALAGLLLALNVRAGFAVRWNEIGVGASWAFAGALIFALMLYSNAHVLNPVDGRIRTFFMTSISGLIAVCAGLGTARMALPQDTAGWIGLGLLTAFYCAAMCTLFILLPRLPSVSTAALNFEPIALLGLGWLFLDQGVSLTQIAGSMVTVGAITWLGLQMSGASRNR